VVKSVRTLVIVLPSNGCIHQSTGRAAIAVTAYWNTTLSIEIFRVFRVSVYPLIASTIRKLRSQNVDSQSRFSARPELVAALITIPIALQFTDKRYNHIAIRAPCRLTALR
jgi:hypothetical protein